MKQYHAIIMVPVQYNIYANDVAQAAATVRAALDDYTVAQRPDGDLATPYILTVAEIKEQDDGIQHPREPSREPTSLLERGRHQPVFDEWFEPDDDPGPRAA